MEKTFKDKLKKVSVFLKRITSRRQLPLYLYLLFLMGAVLRFTNLNWDSYFDFHPDERNISWAVTRIRFFDQLNPKFFAYGGLPIYLYRALGEGVVYLTRNPTWLTDWGKIAVIGRYVSALLSSASLLLIYRVGQLYFSAAAGLLAAFFLAVSPWAVREAHFATTETMLVFLLLLLLLLAHRLVIAGGSVILTVLLGLIQGWALAAKTTSLLFAVIPLMALTVASFKQPLSKKSSRNWLSRVFKKGRSWLISVFIFLIIAGATFLLFSPYTILDLAKFRESMRYETGVVLGRFTVPYTLQFSDTPKYLYQLVTMTWQSGPVALVGLVGFVFLAIKLWRERKASLLILLIFPLLYGGFSGNWFAKFARYNIPLLPYLTLFCAWFITSTLDLFKKSSRPYLILILVNWLIGLLAVWWGLANWSIYLRPQTRLVASRWIYQHIPAGSLIFTEHWNDGLPVGFPGETLPIYPRELLPSYDPDTPEKMSLFAQNLSRASFIIFSTRRIWGTLPRLTAKYPITSRFYQKFLAGELGYQEVARFTAYPQLLGITLPDDAAEETIQVFDHPTVLIFQNTKKLDPEEILARLKK